MSSYPTPFDFQAPQDSPANFGTHIPQQTRLDNTTTAVDNTYMTSYPQDAYSDGYPPPNGVSQVPGSPTSWRHFAGNMSNMIPNLSPASGDYMHPAHTLMQMGNGPGESITMPDTGQRQNKVFGAFQTWPMFDPNID